MGCLNENDNLPHFTILEELSSDLSGGFFKTLSFFSLLMGFPGNQEGHTLQHPNV